MEERSTFQRQISYKSMLNESQVKEYYKDEDNKFTSLTKIYDEQQRRKFLQLQNSNMFTNYKLKNQKQKEEKIDEKQRSRRSRKDKEGRDYKCGCGKTYLSYPALYTHIKQKHDGKEPKGTTRLNSNGPNKRGRPRRQRVEEQLHSIQQGPATTQMPRVLTLTMNKQSMMAFDQYQDVIQGNIFVDQYMTFDKFIDQIQKIKRQQTKQLSLRMSMDEIFAIYLHNMSNICNQSFFQYLQQTLICLRSCVNENIKTFLINYQSTSQIYTRQIIVQTSDDKVFSESQSCQYLPLISEFFILQYAPRHMKKIDQKLMICIIQDLCYWLQQNKLTHLKLSRYSVETISNINIGKMQSY